MTYLLIGFRAVGFICFAIMMLNTVLIAFGPTVPDSTHIILYKGHYLTQEMVRTWQLSVIGFVVFFGGGELIRNSPKSNKKSRYFV